MFSCVKSIRFAILTMYKICLANQVCVGVSSVCVCVCSIAISIVYIGYSLYI